MKLFIYIFILFFSVSACNRKIYSEAVPSSPDSTSIIASSSTTSVIADSPAVATIPACIQKFIDSVKLQPVWNPPAEIYEYLYDNRKVFVMSANCCDFFNKAVDENCNYVCAPSGGFTGKGDGKCIDFFQKAKQQRLVWKDQRKRK